MNVEQAREARVAGVHATSQKWIKKIEKDWRERLERGWDTLWIPSLDNETEEVQEIVKQHFLEMGYGFKMERAEYPEYRMRLHPVQQEPGLFRQILSRIFGGSFA